MVTALIRLDDCRFLAFDVIGQTVALRSCSFHGHSPRSSWGDNNNHSFLYRLSCISKHLQLRTGGFCWCEVLLPTCLSDGNQRIRGEDAAVLLNSVFGTVSVPYVDYIEIFEKSVAADI